MIETFECIEVHVDVQAVAECDKDVRDTCQLVRLGIMNALHRATVALHYEFNKP